ncbi:hypothetical protein J7J83_00545 [bacterium]|nr:hypothetical protein [bacterium]
MDKFLFALFGFPTSFLIVIYRQKIKEFTGSVGFAEKYLGRGGTYTLILLIGVGLFIVTLFYITGTLQSFLRTVFGPLFLMPKSA